MIEWRVGMTQNDPAADLVNVTLTLPTPPPGHFASRTPSYAPQDRNIKALPSRKVAGLLSRLDPSPSSWPNRVNTCRPAHP